MDIPKEKCIEKFRELYNSKTSLPGKVSYLYQLEKEGRLSQNDSFWLQQFQKYQSRFIGLRDKYLTLKEHASFFGREDLEEALEKLDLAYEQVNSVACFIRGSVFLNEAPRGDFFPEAERYFKRR